MELAVERRNIAGKVSLYVDASDVDVRDDAIANELIGELRVCTVMEHIRWHSMPRARVILSKNISRKLSHNDLVHFKLFLEIYAYSKSKDHQPKTQAVDTWICA